MISTGNPCSAREAKSATTLLSRMAESKELPVEKQILIIFAGTNGFIDDLPLTAMKKYEQELFSFVESKYPDVFADILKKREMDADLRAKTIKVLEEFKLAFKP